MNSIVCPRPLQYLIVICTSVLLFTWGLPHTIALRNTMLGIGAVASLYFLIKYKPFVLDWNAAPLILIYCLPVWVLIHFCFFAQEPDLQWLEIKSLWVRVVAGMLIATAMGLLIRKPDRINSLFIFAFFGMSISIVSVYFFSSWKLGHLLAPNDFMDKFLFDRNKVSTAFFSVVDLAVGCASFSYIFSCGGLKNQFGKLITLLVLMGLSIGASVMANSKNGVGVGLILLSIFMVNFLYSLIKKKNSQHLRWGLSLLTAIVALVFLVSFTHLKSATPGWGTLFSDIETAVKIDKYHAWRGPAASRGELFPKNSLGIDVAGNTYERFAWMAAGIRELIRHPFGYGTINQPSFPRWLKQDGIEFDHAGSTHAGWIDLSLSFGFPGILLVFSSLAIAMLNSSHNSRKSWEEFLSIWIALVVLIAGVVQEITFKHTFEAMIFLVTFCAACIATVKISYVRSEGAITS